MRPTLPLQQRLCLRDRSLARAGRGCCARWAAWASCCSTWRRYAPPQPLLSKRSRVAAPAALRGRSAAGAQDVQKEVKTRIVNLIAGCAMVVLSYNLVMLFLRIKVPSLYVYPNAS